MYARYIYTQPPTSHSSLRIADSILVGGVFFFFLSRWDSFMVFNSISFSIRFAPPRIALAFEQRHVRFVKIPITCLVVIILLLLHYVSGKCCAPRYYYSIIIVPARTHRYMSDDRRSYYRSIDDYRGGCSRKEPSGQVRIVCTVVVAREVAGGVKT